MGEEHTDLCCQATNDSFFFLPQKRETMIKNSSVAWQASGWFTRMSEARRELAFRRASASLVFLVWDLCCIHLLKKRGILTYAKNGVLLLNIFFPERSNVLMIWSRVAGRTPKGQRQ